MDAKSQGDRWSTLMDLASEGGNSAAVFYRWVDMLDHPINAEQYERGDSVMIVYEDSDSRWHIEDISTKTKKTPRRVVASHEQAKAQLESNGYTFLRTVEHFQRPRSVEESSGLPTWLGWLLFAVLLMIISAGLIFVVWSVNSSGGVESVLPEG